VLAKCQIYASLSQAGVLSLLWTGVKTVTFPLWGLFAAPAPAPSSAHHLQENSHAQKIEAFYRCQVYCFY
jgi:hypothetical protein